ncbi:hypothetical protein BGZ76_008087, partial [Entomortierella beljakovae]
SLRDTTTDIPRPKKQKPLTIQDSSNRTETILPSMLKVPDVRDVAVQTEVFGGDQISSMSVPPHTSIYFATVRRTFNTPFTLQLSEESSGQETGKYGGDQDSNIIVPQTPLTLRPSEEPSDISNEHISDSPILGDDQEIIDGDEMALHKQHNTRAQFKSN